MVKSVKLQMPIFLFLILLSACTRNESTLPLRELRTVLDPGPATLNPRITLDAAGQMINALTLSALTRFDPDLQVKGDLAESWEISDSGKKWNFKIRPGLKDQEGSPITAQDIASCLENYRTGTPISPFRDSFPSWIGTRVKSDTVTFELKDPDPYLANNVSLLRFFRVKGNASPCTDPTRDNSIVGSGAYRLEPWELAPEHEVRLLPVSNQTSAIPIQIQFIRDDNTKALKLIHGDIDAILNSLAPSRRQWLIQKYPDRFKLVEREGSRVSYLAFNVKDPLLKNKKVRQAIAKAIDRNEITQNKFLNTTRPADSLLYPSMPESFSTPFHYDPKEAERLLDEAGFPRQKNGIRFTLKYKTTPIREGTETAMIFQSMLRKVGIELVLDVVEPAVFFASIRKGFFQLFSSRWLGIKDGSILYLTLHSGKKGNRTGYSDPAMDQLLDQAIQEPSLEKRKKLMRQVQLKAADDLPYLPLWYWESALVLRKDLKGLSPQQISLSGTLEALTVLR